MAHPTDHTRTVLLVSPIEDAGQDIPLQHVERLLVAEEVRDADQHVLQQRLGFLRVQVEVVAVRLQIGDAVDLHAALDPSQNGRPLVMTKIVRGARAQDDHDLAQRPFCRLVAQIVEVFLVFDRRQMYFLCSQPQVH